MIRSATASATKGPGVASARRASRSNSKNNASGAASTTTKYFAHKASPMVMPRSSQWTMRPRRNAAWKA